MSSRRAGRFPEPLAARINLASENRRCSLPPCRTVCIRNILDIRNALGLILRTQQSHARSTCDFLDDPISDDTVTLVDFLLEVFLQLERHES